MTTSRSSAPGLYWGVRGSFIRYVQEGAAGSFSLSDGATVDDSDLFHFPLHAIEHDAATDRWRLSFGGDVVFEGHFGMLRVRIARPQLFLGPEGGLLMVADVRSTAAHAEGVRTIARLPGVSPRSSGGMLLWPTCIPELTMDGVDLFGGVYAEGTPLDALRLVTPE